MKKARKSNGDKAMERFDGLLQRLFTVAKADLKKAEEEVEEIVEDVTESTEQPTPDE